MSSIRHPKEKKRLAYARDHYAKNESDKARKGWGIKKHKARRAFRHALNSLTQAAAVDGGSDEKISAVTQRRVRRWPVPSLQKHVAHKMDRRERSVGAKKSRGVRMTEFRKASEAKLQANQRLQQAVFRRIQRSDRMSGQKPLIIWRDSVCAGDDLNPPHQLVLRIRNETISDVLRELSRRGFLPRIVGGKATWVLEADQSLAVVAQQWRRARFLIHPGTRAKTYIREGTEPHLRMKYLAQVDPDAVFKCLREGKPVPES